jgi:hypothetical protein
MNRVISLPAKNPATTVLAAQEDNIFIVYVFKKDAPHLAALKEKLNWDGNGELTDPQAVATAFGHIDAATRRDIVFVATCPVESNDGMDMLYSSFPELKGANPNAVEEEQYMNMLHSTEIYSDDRVQIKMYKQHDETYLAVVRGKIPVLDPDAAWVDKFAALPFPHVVIALRDKVRHIEREYDRTSVLITLESTLNQFTQDYKIDTTWIAPVCDKIAELNPAEPVVEA